MKTKNRAPRKILSVLLCVLMLSTTLCIGNPFTASAVIFNGTPNRGKVVSSDSGNGYFGCTNVDYYDYDAGRNTIYLLYDHNPQTQTAKGSSQVDLIGASGQNPTSTAIVLYEDEAQKYFYVAATSTNSKIASKTASGAGVSVYVKIVCFNSSALCNIYDLAVSKYGWSNTGGYSPDSWATYIVRLNDAKSIITNGVHVTSPSDTNLQRKIYDAWYSLKAAIDGLRFPEVTLGNVFVQVPGATIAGPEKIEIKKASKITVRLHEGYTQSVPGVQVVYKDGTVNNYSGTLGANNTYEYSITLSNANVKSITPTNVNPNRYNVVLPSDATGLYVSKPGVNTVTHGDNFTFTLTKKTGYTQTAPAVYVNGNAFGGVDNGDGSYTYTIERIAENKTVTFGTQPVNGYNISYNTGEGTTAEGSPAKIDYFDTKEIKITVGEAYTQSEPQPTVDNGTLTFKEKDGKTFVYTLSAPFGDEPKVITVTVPSLKKNTYSAALPSGTGYKVTHKDAVDGVVSKIVYGTDFAFGVDLDPQYNRSDVVVKYNGTPLEPDGGVYTIPNVRNNIGISEGDPEITVEGVKLNNYYITLPLESGTGFTIEVGKDADGNPLNAKSVLSGTDFNFKFFLDPAYSDSIPTIKVSRDGGNTYTVLTEKDGKYDINEVLSDCIVVVDGVEKNTYTVKFLDGNGDVDETVENVEYGSEVKYPGRNDPKKDALLVSDTIDPETGIRTVVTKEYKFIGWSQDTTNVTSDMTVSPIFEVSEVTKTYPKEGGDPTVVVTPKTANVLFISDGVIVHKETVEKETKFAGWNGVPVKASSNPYEKYEFLGWDTDKDGVVDVAAGESTAIDSVKDDVMFVAVFKSNLPTQKVSFYNFDGSDLLYSADVKRGEKAEYALSAIPSRTDNANTYAFAGWSFNKDADENGIVENLIVADSDINLYAAYEKTPIVYSYKYVDYDYDKVTGEPEPFQEGTFYFTDDDKPSYKYLGVTPTREPDVDKVYAFDGWNVKQIGYTTVYTATYVSSVREYTSDIKGNGIGYTVSDNATVKYGDTFTFTVTLDEGYEETAPTVTYGENDTPLTGKTEDGKTYTYEVKLDGATAEEVADSLDITVGATINNYDVIITGDTGCTVDPLHFDSKHGGEGSFIVTLKDSYIQNDPTVNAEGDVEVTLVSKEDGKYVYSVKNIKSDAEITVTTKINEYAVKVLDWNDVVLFDGNVKHGEAPKFTRPAKPADKNGAYDFLGYDTNNDGAADVTVIENVTAPVTAKVVYKYNHRHDTDPDENPEIWELIKIEKASCTADGLKHYACKHGDGQTTTKVIPARGHNMTEWHIDKAPTCTETGLKSRHCQNTVATDEYEACSYAENGVVIPATGHHDSDGDYKCDDCGADLGHCSSCICHKGNVLSKVIRKICTILSKTFHTKIKCCKCMKWYGDEISSIS